MTGLNTESKKVYEKNIEDIESKNEHLEINKLSREMEAFFKRDAIDSKQEIDDLMYLRKTIKTTKKHINRYGS